MQRHCEYTPILAINLHASASMTARARHTESWPATASDWRTRTEDGAAAVVPKISGCSGTRTRRDTSAAWKGTPWNVRSRKRLRFAMAVCTFGSHSSTFEGGVAWDSTSMPSSSDRIPLRPPAVGADAELVPESSRALYTSFSTIESASTKAAATLLNQKRDSPVGSRHSRGFRLGEENSKEY